MATVHLISGLPCSGKTTYSNVLHESVGGVILTLDQWLITIYGKYLISEIGQPEHIKRVVICRELMWERATEVLTAGMDVILDDGFFWRSDRLKYYAMVQEAGFRTHIHALLIPLDVLRQRIERRNARLPKWNFWIDPTLLESFISQYEIPLEDEADEITRLNSVEEA